MGTIARQQRVLVTVTALLAGIGLLAAVFGAPVSVVILANAATIATAFGAVTARPDTAGTADLIAEVSHEMRTPLTGILGTLELLTDSTIPLEPSEADELLVSAHGEANLLLHIVGNLHARSRLDREILTPARVPTDIRVLIGRAIARAPQVARRCYVEGGSPAVVVGDPQLIMQIVTNVVQNTERYAPEGDVRIGFTRSNGHLLVSFRDSGPGVPAHRAEQVFAVSASSEGLGLGLPLSRQLAQAMDGDLTCDNAGSKGALFALRLPASDDPVPDSDRVDIIGNEHQAHSPRARLLVDLADALDGRSLERVVGGIAKIYQELLRATGAILFVPRRDGSFHSACCHSERAEIPAEAADHLEEVLESGQTMRLDDLSGTTIGAQDQIGGSAALLLPVHDGAQVVAVLAVAWKDADSIPSGAPVAVAEALAELTASAIARTALTRDIVFERRLRASVMDELPIAVSVFAGDPPQVIDWNSKERELLGIADNVIRPRDLGASQDLFQVQFADGTPLTAENAPVTEAIRTGKVSGPFILRVRRTDGTRVHTRTYCAPFFDDDGDVAGAVVTSEALDLTLGSPGSNSPAVGNAPPSGVRGD